jgi:hypothetical protein
MDWLSFIAALVGHLAWPAAIAAVALLFRSQVQALFQNLNRLKWRDIEAEFGEKVDQIREDVREIESSPDFRDEPVAPKLIELVETHPHLAVLEAWKQLERSIIDVSVRKFNNDRRLPLSKHLSDLVKAELLPAAMVKAVEDIREVRNQAVHETDASIPRGRAYVLLDTIADIVGFISRIA